MNKYVTTSKHFEISDELHDSLTNVLNVLHDEIYDIEKRLQIDYVANNEMSEFAKSCEQCGKYEMLIKMINEII